GPSSTTLRSSWMLPPPPGPTLFPYTTLFRSRRDVRRGAEGPRDVGRLRQGARAVRAPDRQLPGHPAQVRQHAGRGGELEVGDLLDRKSTRLNSSHEWISYAVFCLKKKKSQSN